MSIGAFRQRYFAGIISEEDFDLAVEQKIAEQERNGVRYACRTSKAVRTVLNYYTTTVIILFSS